MAEETVDPVFVLQWALKKISMEELVGSPEALKSFRQFIYRGTDSQRRRLIPESGEAIEQSVDHIEQYNSNVIFQNDPFYPPENDKRYTGSTKRRFSDQFPSEQSTCGKRSRTNSTESITSLFTSPPSTPSSPSADILLKAKRFFDGKLGARSNRLHYIIRVLQGILEAPEPETDSLRDMWNDKSAIFSKPESTGLTARLQALYNGHRKIRKARQQYLYAARFCYIYLEHDLDELSKSHCLALSQGRGKMTAAIELQAEIINTSTDAIKAERKAGRGYVQLLIEGGPGFILRLGSNVSTIWERKLSVSDITLIIQFLKTHVLDLYHEIKSYDHIATQVLLDGFTAYGWSCEDILASNSSLFSELKRYIDLAEYCSAKSMSPIETDLEPTTVLPAPLPPFYSTNDMETLQSADFPLTGSSLDFDLFSMTSHERLHRDSISEASLSVSPGTSYWSLAHHGLLQENSERMLRSAGADEIFDFNWVDDGSLTMADPRASFNYDFSECMFSMGDIF